MSGETILVLDADSVAGLAITQSLGVAGYRCCLGAPTESAAAFASRWVSRRVVYPDPLGDLGAFQHWLRDWIRRNPVALIVPSTESTLVPLHHMRDDVEIASRAAIPSEYTLDLALDKERLRRLAVDLGVPTPASTYVTTPEELGDRRIEEWLREGGVVVKPVRSKAWDGPQAHEFAAVIVSSRDELERVVAERIRHVPVQVQQWVPGRGFGVGLLARHGETTLCLGYERLHEVPLTGGGSSYRRTVPLPPELCSEAQALLRALRCHGVAMVEFRCDPATGRHWLMEINVRFWGSLPLAIFAGADFPRALVEMLLSDRAPPPLSSTRPVYARNLTREVAWLKLMLKRRRRPSPYHLVPPLGRALLEWGRCLTGSEAWDGFSWHDPGPFVGELGSLIGTELGSAATHVSRATTRMLAPRRSRRRASRYPAAHRVLLLCYGNICRSAYAEAYLRQLDGTDREFRSAGFFPETGRTSPVGFQRLARRHGVELAPHRSRVVSPPDAEWADLIVLMDQRCHQLLTEVAVDSLRKVIWLGALDGGALEIEDPYEQSAEQVERILGRMDHCLERLVGGAARPLP